MSIWEEDDKYVILQICPQIENVAQYLKKEMTLKEIKEVPDNFDIYLLKCIRSELSIPRNLASSNISCMYDVYKNLDSYILSPEDLYEGASKYLLPRIDSTRIIRAIEFYEFNLKCKIYEECHIQLNILLRNVYTSNEVQNYIHH